MGKSGSFLIIQIVLCCADLDRRKTTKNMENFPSFSKISSSACRLLHHNTSICSGCCEGSIFSLLVIKSKGSCLQSSQMQCKLLTQALSEKTSCRSLSIFASPPEINPKLYFPSPCVYCSLNASDPTFSLSHWEEPNQQVPSCPTYANQLLKKFLQPP